MCVLNIIPNTVTLSLPQDDEVLVPSICRKLLRAALASPRHCVGPPVCALRVHVSLQGVVREELCRHIVTSLTAESLLVLIILAQRLSTFVISWHTQANY